MGNHPYIYIKKTIKNAKTKFVIMILTNNYGNFVIRRRCVWYSWYAVITFYAYRSNRQTKKKGLISGLYILLLVGWSHRSHDRLSHHYSIRQYGISCYEKIESLGDGNIITGTHFYLIWWNSYDIWFTSSTNC